MQILGDIALFVEVVNAKNFTEASKRTGVPVSTISRRISNLEKTIALKLFNRTTRKVEVTEAGKAYYARCAHLIAEAQLAHEEISETVNTPKGTLRISCTPDFATAFLPEVLIEYAGRYPDVQIELDLSHRKVDLISENFDASLRFGRLPDSNLIARKIASLPLSLYASPQYLKSSPPIKVPSDLSKHRCIRMNSDENGSNWTLNSIKNQIDEPIIVPVHGKYCVSSFLFIRKLLLNHVGIGLMDDLIVKNDFSKGDLVRVLPLWYLSPVDLTLLTPSRLLPARVRLFADLLRDRLATILDR